MLLSSRSALMIPVPIPEGVDAEYVSKRAIALTIGCSLTSSPTFEAASTWPAADAPSPKRSDEAARSRCDGPRSTFLSVGPTGLLIVSIRDCRPAGLIKSSSGPSEIERESSGRWTAHSRPGAAKSTSTTTPSPTLVVVVPAGPGRKDVTLTVPVNEISSVSTMACIPLNGYWNSSTPFTFPLPMFPAVES